MKISVITVVYNNAAHIGDCIKSVISQSYGDIEYIVINDGSTDETPDIIGRYKTNITKIISQENRGYVYAMNEGLKSATGEIIGFLHSDDFYSHNDVIGKMAGLFGKYNSDSVYGDLVYVKRNEPTKAVRYWKSGEYAAGKIRRGWMAPHPAFFVKKWVYDKYGYYDTSFSIAADYEMMLRFLLKHRISAYYLSEVLVKMRIGGMSNKSVKNIIRKSAEDYKACRMHGLGFRTVVMKNLIKLPQLFSAII
ncbi:MAG: glycosyltransferase family 2 protein [Candidatus Omnitrophica bacterium]|nr:glycosyltransferase family 2 protein [Candidatus Omnitrophota bacterium]